MDRNRISKEYGLLPLSFEPTTVSPQAFIARTAGGTVWLDGKQLLLSLARPDTRHRQRSTGPLTVKLSLEGADPSASAKPTGELPGKTNYFTGENQSKWRTNVANFSAVEYSSIYPGIDLKYYGDRAGHLEHDFLVKPGADPAVIQFNVAGADALALTSNGDLQMTLRRDSTKETAILQRPIVYQEIEGRRTLVEASYTLRSANEVAFQIGPYDRSKQLVIDPVLDYSTFLGGGILTSAYAITVDGGGNAYVVGHTGADGSFPVTNGGSCAFTLAFEPAQKIAYKADLNVTTSASSKAVIIPMSGTGD